MGIVKSDPILIKTNADELYLPSRLIYRIKSKNAVLKKLKRLECIDKHPSQQRWMMACTDDMLDFNNWEKSYLDAEKRNDPIIVAFIRFPKKTAMHVLLRSYERVTPVLKLLDKYLPGDAAMGTHHDSCQKIVMAMNRREIPSPDSFFEDEGSIDYSDNMRRVDELEEQSRLTGKNHDNEIDELFAHDFLELSKRGSTLPDLQRVRLECFYADGPEVYEQSMLAKRAMVLAKHFAGGKLNPLKFMEKVVSNKGKNISDLKGFLR